MSDHDRPASATDDLATSHGRRHLNAAETDLNVHVFSVSAGLVGVCLIGIIRIGINIKPGYNTIADELLAVDSLTFITSCLLAYSSLRTPGRARTKRLEAYADRVFIAGMITMSLAGALVAFSLL